MKKIVIGSLVVAAVAVIVFLFWPNWRNENPIAIDIAAFDTAKLGPKDATGYLTLDFPVEPFEHAKLDVEERLGVKLESRGDAHITIVTPPEYKNLSKILNPEEIREIFLKEAEQSRFIRPVCIGKGESKKDQTWFVVVEVTSVGRAREALNKLYIERGGSQNDFSATDFYPHVTLGFNSRDLYAQDGVIKNEATCKFPTGHSRRTGHY